MRLLTILHKDLTIRLRDLRAWLYLLAAPLLLGFIMGSAFGGQEHTSPLYAVPLAVVDADQGLLGQALADALAGIEVETPDGVRPLFEVLRPDTPDAARALVEQGQARGAVLIPADFSDRLTRGQSTALQVLTDPTSPVASLVIVSAVRRLVPAFAGPSLAGRLVGERMAEATALGPDRAASLSAAASAVVAELASAGPPPVPTLDAHTQGAAGSGGVMAAMMPAMAVFFLVWAMFGGTRVLLAEQANGTLARLLVTGVAPAEVLLGKLGAALVTGLLQMAALMLISGGLFGVTWGPLPALAALTLATVGAAGGVGALVAALARDEDQAGILGALLSLVFGVLGGNFISLQGAPVWLDLLSKTTLNRWALDGYLALALHQGTLADIMPHLGVLTLIAGLTFGLALPRINRRLARGLA